MNYGIASLIWGKPNALRRSSIAFALLFLIGIWSVVVYDLQRSRAGLVEQAEIRSQQNARVLAEYAQSNFRRINELILDLRSQWGGDWQAFASRVKRRQEVISDIAFQVAVIDRNGLLSFSNLAVPSERTDLHEREHFRVHADNPEVDKLFISKALKGKVSGKWTIQFTRPIIRDGIFDGVMVVSTSPSLFTELSGSLGVADSGTAAMTRATGEIMARHPHGDQFLGKMIKGTPYLLDNTMVTGRFHRISDTDGVERIFGYYRLQEYGVTFSVGEAQETALAQYGPHRTSVIFVATLVTALISLLFVRLLHSISEIQTLTHELAEETNIAKQATIAKSQFLANMSHEIRTPMNAILGMHRLLGATDLTKSQRDYAGKAEGAAKALLGIINDILDFSKIDAKKLELDLQPVRLDQILRDLAVVLSTNASSKGLDILYDVDRTIPAQLIADALRLQQILLNLASNAIKFTARGHVIIRIQKVNTASADQPVRIRFAVEDTGIGIAQEKQSSVFRDFEQAESSTTRRFGGTGLGLAISQHLVQLMGGDISLQSELGKGSIFSFELSFSIDPTSVVDADKPQRTVLSNPGLASHLNVLVVDDNADAREIALRTMHSFGWTVDAAASGIEAESLVRRRLSARAQAYECVFVDWLMPAIDGWATIKLVQDIYKSFELASPRFVMVSSLGREQLASRTAEEQGFLAAYIVKPATPSMFFDAALSGESGVARTRQHIRTAKKQLAAMHILVVEDNQINQQVAKELLESEGAQVTLAEDGKDGVAHIENAVTSFDAILMDIQMPVMDGYEATKLIRKNPQWRDLPIIGLTANAMQSDREACIAAGMNDHLGKPFDLKILVSTLGLR